MHSPEIPQEFPKDSRKSLLRFGEFGHSRFCVPQEPILYAAQTAGECPKTCSVFMGNGFCLVSPPFSLYPTYHQRCHCHQSCASAKLLPQPPSLLPPPPRCHHHAATAYDVATLPLLPMLRSCQASAAATKLAAASALPPRFCCRRQLHFHLHCHCCHRCCFCCCCRHCF